MATYMAQRIIEGAFDAQGGYEFVIGRRPDLKAGIDHYLIDNGHASLITGIE